MIFFKNGVLAKIRGTQEKRENTRFFFFLFFFAVWNISVIRFKIGAEIAILDLAKAPKLSIFYRFQPWIPL